MSDPRPGTGAGAPTVLRMILGRRLQEARQHAGLSLDDAAKALRATPLTIRRLEKAEVGLKILGLDLLEPGVAVGHRWRPDAVQGDTPTDAEVRLWTGVGIKP